MSNTRTTYFSYNNILILINNLSETRNNLSISSTVTKNKPTNKKYDKKSLFDVRQSSISFQHSFVIKKFQCYNLKYVAVLLAYPNSLSQCHTARKLPYKIYRVLHTKNSSKLRKTLPNHLFVLPYEIFSIKLLQLPTTY